MRWGPGEIDALERAIVEQLRVHVTRRGSELVIVPCELRSVGAAEEVRAVHPTTGDELRFTLDEIDDFTVLF